MAERLTFEGNFCDIAKCREERWGKHCPNGACSQRKVWERLKAYEDTGAVPAVSVPQWISVKDRLPEDGEDVLIWYEYFRYGPYNRMYTTYDIAYQYNGYWEDAGGSLGPKARVFAWMPLPEPPKGENDG